MHINTSMLPNTSQSADRKCSRGILSNFQSPEGGQIERSDVSVIARPSGSLWRQLVCFVRASTRFCVLMLWHAANRSSMTSLEVWFDRGWPHRTAVHFGGQTTSTVSPAVLTHNADPSSGLPLVRFGTWFAFTSSPFQHFSLSTNFTLGEWLTFYRDKASLFHSHQTRRHLADKHIKLTVISELKCIKFIEQLY